MRYCFRLTRPAYFLSLALALVSSIAPVLAAPNIGLGISLALSGPAATYGIDIKNTIMFANDELASGKYQLHFEEDKCSGKEAVSAAHKFINILQLKYALGFACSSTVL